MSNTETVVTVDELLKGILSSLSSTKTSVSDLLNGLKQDSTEQFPLVIQSLLKKANTDSVEGVSLLTLKNHALLSYLNNLALVVLSQLENLEDNDDDKNDKLREKVIENSIVQRVTLEKGIKPLEKKLNYQLDKMVRAYTRMENDDEKLVEKLNKAEDEGEENSSEDESSEEDDNDALSYRPDASALAKLTKTTIGDKKKVSKSSSTDNNKESKEKYRPPKISAIAPPSSSIITNDESNKNRNNKKLQSMEEYLQEQSDLPTMESSIGSTIVDHGRGGVKTQYEKNKEREIQTYEESNFVRLPTTQTKKSFKQKQRDKANTFGGEDWSMFNGNNDRDLKSGTSRKRKAASAWDRVKKRR
ncbi:nucleolar protein required for ribosomal RNA processing [Scheffersomyces amazonensis]|uniref:nucleolar protein required for ribosomal RNA processing n=1 Tax=Scheffersomyces amazonensis TaxID=1078765 RepID=UPI00315C4F92